VRSLAELYQLTIVIITHDLDFLWQVTDRVAVLGEGKVVGVGSMAELSEMTHPIIREYFDGPRGRAAQEQAQAGVQPHSEEDPWTQK
jgi:phospholipid/cholesterol/gamma-HCH transport system ATP-binding protein